MKSDLDRWITATLLITIWLCSVANYEQTVWFRGQTRRFPAWVSKSLNIGSGVAAITLGILIATIGK